MTKFTGLLFIGVWTLAARAETLSVRLIDSKTARPVANVVIRMKAGKFHGPPVTIPEIRAMTDQNGNAIFLVDPASTPEVFFFLDHDQCSALGPYSVASIVTLGIVAENRCLHRSQQLKDLVAGPGEMIIYRETWSLWDRLKHTRDAI